MNRVHIDRLLNSIKNIIFNKPVENTTNTDESNEFYELEQAILYLSNCLIESNKFLKNLTAGNLKVEIPNRHNFLAGNLKDLHARLQHLTWIATRVSNGDYKQKIDFFGEFSNSFNKMIEQLEQRENSLIDKNKVLTQTSNLLTCVVDSIDEQVLFVDKYTYEVLYANQKASETLYDMKKKEYMYPQECKILKNIFEFKNDDDSVLKYEINDSDRKIIKEIHTYIVEWEGKQTIAYIIYDITDKEIKENQIESLMYTDDMTGLFNRRYAYKTMNDLMADKQNFSMAFIDIDNLKYVNDTYGHTVGDELIKLVTDTISSGIRINDSLCRVGGDEFILILPQCDEKIAKDKLQLIHVNISNSNLPYKTFISYGFVSTDENVTSTIEELIAIADDRMYKFKVKQKLKNNSKM